MQSKIFVSAASNPPFCLKAEVGCDRGMGATDQGQHWGYASDCPSLHEATLHCFALSTGNYALSAPWKTKAVRGHGKPHGFLCFANPVGESL